jgi:hypothetical protein
MYRQKACSNVHLGSLFLIRIQNKGHYASSHSHAISGLKMLLIQYQCEVLLNLKTFFSHA